MEKIIAIGGGEIGRPGTKIETLSIDKEIIKQSGKVHPRLLFIPTASSDSASYYEVIQNYFGKKLGCTTEVLYLIKGTYSKKEIENKIFNTDIIYVGGGNTLKMMKIWRKLGIDKLLKQAHKKGIILSGISAGAICWFNYGNSDSLQFTKKDAPMIKVKGLGLINGLFCPHYDVESKRKAELKKNMLRTKEIGIALDNCTAIEIINDHFKIISSKKTSFAYKVYWKNNTYFEEKLIQKKLLPIEILFKKPQNKRNTG